MRTAGDGPRLEYTTLINPLRDVGLLLHSLGFEKMTVMFEQPPAT